MEPVTLRTERLELSVPTEADVDAITAAVQDPEVPRFTTLPWPYERQHADEFVANAVRWWTQESELTWAIRHDGSLIGMIGLHALERSGGAEIGYWMAAAARGRGYLTEAARTVIDFGFSKSGPDLVRIEWRAVTGNIASARAARTLGFHYEGLLRQGLSDPRGRHDGWMAALLTGDDRMPQPWPVLED